MRERNDECLCTVPLFCFKWEANVCPALEKGHVCLSNWLFVSVQLFTELFTLLHAVVSVHAQLTTLYALAQAQGCAMWVVVGLWYSSTTTKKSSRCFQFMVRCWRRCKWQSTIKRAELWAFTMALAGLIGPSTHPNCQYGMIHGLWSREEGCVGPQQKDSDLR